MNKVWMGLRLTNDIVLVSGGGQKLSPFLVCANPNNCQLKPRIHDDIILLGPCYYFVACTSDMVLLPLE